MIKTALLLLLLAGLVFAQKSDTRMTVAVNELEGRGLAPGEAMTLTDALSSHLSNTNVFRIMERGKMDVILKEQGFQQSGACTDQACIIEMGQLLGVQQIITGSIGKVGGTYSINVRMINVATSELTRTVSKTFVGKIDGVLTDVMPAVAGELAKAVSPGAHPSSAQASAVSATASGVPDAASSKPVYKRWYFWAGAATVAAGTVAVAVLTNNDSGPDPVSSTPGTDRVIPVQGHIE